MILYKTYSKGDYVHKYGSYTMNKTDTQTELFQQCKAIANQIQTGEYDRSEGDEPCNAYDYLESILDIEYIVNGKAEYLGARVLVSFGGPNIWINTKTQTVEGYWWNDRAEAYYDQDNLGLDDCLNELWGCR